MLKNNKNVCNIYEVGMHDSWNYMVMDKLSFPLNKLFSNWHYFYNLAKRVLPQKQSVLLQKKQYNNSKICINKVTFIGI